MKKETIEEVAKRIYPINIVSDGYDTNMLCRTGFYIGYELGQERSYSEEDIMFAYEQGAKLAMISQSNLALHKGEFPNPKQWFEQFKKK